MGSFSSGNTPQVMRDAYVAPSSVAFTQPTQASQTTAQSYGQLHLPEGRVVHIIPTQSPTPSQKMYIPAGFIFSFAIGAMLQSQTSQPYDLEHHISEPFRLLATKVTRVEWPFQKNNTASNGKQPRDGSKKNRKKKKGSARDEFFDGTSFFHTVATQENSTFDFTDKNIAAASERLTPEARRLARLRDRTSREPDQNISDPM